MIPVERAVIGPLAKPPEPEKRNYGHTGLRVLLAVPAAVASAALSALVMGNFTPEVAVCVGAGPAFAALVLFPFVGFDPVLLVAAVLANAANTYLSGAVHHLTLLGSLLLALALYGGKHFRLWQAVVLAAVGYAAGLYLPFVDADGNPATPIVFLHWFQIFFTWQLPAAVLVACFVKSRSHWLR